jgi:hypothetical protein
MTQLVNNSLQGKGLILIVIVGKLKLNRFAEPSSNDADLTDVHGCM